MLRDFPCNMLFECMIFLKIICMRLKKELFEEALAFRFLLKLIFFRLLLSASGIKIVWLVESAYRGKTLLIV